MLKSKLTFWSWVWVSPCPSPAYAVCQRLNNLSEILARGSTPGLTELPWEAPRRPLFQSSDVTEPPGTGMKERAAVFVRQQRGSEPTILQFLEVTPG